MSDRSPQPHDPEEVDRRFREIVAGLELERRIRPVDPDPGADRADDRTHGDRRPGDLGPGDPGPGDPGPDEQRPADTHRDDPDRAGDAGRSEEPRPPERRTSHLGPGTPAGMATDHRSYEPPEEDDHFVPPPPPPLPAGDLHFWAILGGLVLGPLLVFLSAVIPLLGRAWTGIGAVLTVVGFVLLVLRQPRRRREDGDWGAQV